MSRTVYVNGAYLPEEEAKISVFDRGFLFSDGVYEVSSVLNGKLIDNEAHLARLARSLKALEMRAPISAEEIVEVQNKLIEQNNLTEGLVYLQVTRGSADRDFAYPKNPKPSLVMFTQSKNVIDNPMVKKGMKIISTEDIRWARRDIKTVGLLAASMAKMQAIAAGADDAWFVEDEMVTEGSSNNAYIIKHDDTLVTRQISNKILAGITRSVILKLVDEQDLTFEERPFSLQEAYEAKEAFVSSATTFVMPVVSIDGHSLSGGKPGAMTMKIRDYYIKAALAGLEQELRII